MSYFKVPGTLKDTGERIFAEVTVLETDIADITLTCKLKKNQMK